MLYFIMHSKKKLKVLGILGCVDTKENFCDLERKILTGYSRENHKTEKLSMVVGTVRITLPVGLLGMHIAMGLLV